MNHLVVAHPGHELLLHGWISRTRPVVHVLTDGSGHGSTPRLAATAEFLRDAGARPGAIFGRLSDREAYAMILERNTALLLSLATDLAAEFVRQPPAMVVNDAVEDYNPVHDLCRLVAGAAIALARVDTRQCEYPVVRHPHPAEAATVIELDDAEFARKMERARRLSAIVPDIEELLSRHGVDTYRREAFCEVLDWAAIGENAAPPLYERYGEQRVASGRYTQVIRRHEHMLPLRDALRAAVEKRSCAF